MNKLIVISCLVLICLGQTPIKDEVNPESIGWPSNLPFKIYSGYLDIYNNGSLLTHYMFLTSMSSTPATDPVVLWLNGGPGCSSLLGLMNEIGPYLFLGYSNQLQNNTEFAWNRNTNLLFLESPPGVGFSINNITNYTYSDDNTAETNFLSVQAFFARFIGYTQNKFWISGESYAGMYIPFLADKIRVNNLNLRPNTSFIQLQGFLIGNGAFILDWTMIGTYQINTYFTHQFFNDAERENYYRYCFSNPNSSRCQLVQQTINNVVANTDTYDIYGYTYNYQKPRQSENGEEPKEVKTFSERTQQVKALMRKLKSENLSSEQILNAPATSPDAILAQYFNNITVQKGLHLYDTLQKYNKNFVWGQCSDYINQNYNNANDSTHLYPGLLEQGYQILIYSGNVDAAVPFTYTQYCLNDLINNFNVNLTLVQDWKIWSPLPSQQLGGWYNVWRNNNFAPGVTTKNNFTFAIVRAAGHEVPMYQHESSFIMFENFINGRSL